MKRIYIVFLLLFYIVTVNAQEIADAGIKYNVDIINENGQITNVLEIDFNGLSLRKQEMVSITPEVISTNSGKMIQYPSIVIAGSKRYKYIERAQYYRQNYPGYKIGELIKYTKKSKSAKVSYTYSLPCETWMHDAGFNVSEIISGCTSCPSEPKNILYSYTLQEKFIPEYKVTYLTPPAEPVKQRSETFIARINYQVNKYEVLYDFKNNAHELEEVSKVMTDLLNNDDLTINRISVVGYASPEGSVKNNQILSENRAKSFLEYLRLEYSFRADNINAEGRGEDWNGLYEAVRNSNVKGRDEVLAIINKTSDPDIRKKEIKKLSDGSTYKILLEQFHPQLRRNEYEVSYISRPFDVEAAKEVIKTKPQLLSLEEIYLVAISYPKESEEFKSVFDIASRMYPQDKYAIINTAALEIESGAYDTAIKRLLDLSDTLAYNNLGVAYVKKGDIQTALSYFTRAADAGDENGKHNLEEITKHINEY